MYRQGLKDLLRNNLFKCWKAGRRGCSELGLNLKHIKKHGSPAGRVGSKGIGALLRGLGINDSAGEQFYRALIGQWRNIPGDTEGANQGGWCRRNV